MPDQRYHGPRRALLALAVAAGAVWWWRRRPFRVAVEGASMAPTLRAGDFLLAVRPPRRPVRRGALVVVEHPSRPGFEIVKRVEAVGGALRAGRTILPGEVWVVGDAAEASTDSRSFGPVPEAAIRGVARWRYWPPMRAGRVR
jgi:nickel-type superoxide dismutase maturation protease